MPQSSNCGYGQFAPAREFSFLGDPTSVVCADLDADSHIDVFVTSHDPTVDVSHLVSESGDPIRQNKILFGDGRGGLFNTAGDAATE